MARRRLPWRRDPDAPWRPEADPNPSSSPGSPRPAEPERGASKDPDEVWRPGYAPAGGRRPAPIATERRPSAEPSHEPILSGESLARTYPGRNGVTAVKDVSISVYPGEFLSVMGPSGSGKSTLLGLLAGLDHPERGSVRLRGRDLDSLNGEERLRLRRKSIGVVFQSFGLMPTLSALENVELPLRIAGADLEQARTASIRWLTRLGLSDRLDNRIFELSAGQQQRIAISRALVIEPDVLLADEPIAEVDTENADIILDALAEVPRRGGAVLAATHNPAALAYSDRVVLLRDGRIEGEGTAEQIAGRLSTD